MTLEYTCHQCGGVIPEGASTTTANGLLYHQECFAEGDEHPDAKDERIAELEATIETLRAQHTDLLDDLDTLDGKYVAAQAELKTVQREYAEIAALHINDLAELAAARNAALSEGIARGDAEANALMWKTRFMASDKLTGELETNLQTNLQQARDAAEHQRDMREQAEAELAQAKYNANRYRELMDRSQSELAALKARRCETCGNWMPDEDTTIYGWCETVIDEENPIATAPGFCCSRWAAREEG